MQRVALYILHNRLLVIVVLPALFALFTSAMKAWSTRNGPSPFKVLFLPRQVDVEHRALGFELLLGAITTQISFLSAFRVVESVAERNRLGPPSGSAGAYNPQLVELFNWHIPQANLAFYLVGGLAFWVVCLAMATRRHGWRFDRRKRRSQLREEYATIPTVLGILGLLLVYALNPDIETWP